MSLWRGILPDMRHVVYLESINISTIGGQGKMDAYSARQIEYEKYLVANRLVNRDKVKYYSNWADKFLHGII